MHHPTLSRPASWPSWPFFAPVLSAALLALAPLTARTGNAAEPAAQAAGASEQRLDGTYVYSAEKSESVEKAIDQTVSKLNFLIQTVARGRLQKTNPIRKKIAIQTSGAEVTITVDADPPARSPLDGTPVSWRRSDGESFELSTQRVGAATLRQKFVAPDGQRTNEYQLSPDGQTLNLRVTISSPRLKEPLRYHLVYRRG